MARPQSGLRFKVFRALLARVLFAVHGLTAVWRAAAMDGNLLLWIFAIPIILIFIEGGIRIVEFNSIEPRW